MAGRLLILRLSVVLEVVTDASLYETYSYYMYETYDYFMYETYDYSMYETYNYSTLFNNYNMRT